MSSVIASTMMFVPYTVQAERVRAYRPERQHGSLPEPLYVCGDLWSLAAPSVAIVGTRAPSEAGRRLAQRFAGELSAAGVCIISGLARGIDAAAHLGALEAKAPTIGVLAGGHARFYPKEHTDIAQRMVREGGAVVSPFPPEEAPYPCRFLSRNGIIVALADAVVIIEAPQRSGSLNTASWAADASVPVLVVPGDVDRPKVAGCLDLIRDGAMLVRNTDDILEAMGLGPRCKPQPAKLSRTGEAQLLPFSYTLNEQSMSALDPLLSADAEHIIAILRDGPRTLETCVLETQLPISRVIQTKTMLSFTGRIIEGHDGYFALVE